MNLGLNGARSVVAGATRGIGRAIAESLAAEGSNLAICARNAGEVEKARIELESFGVRAVGAGVDLSDRGTVEQWLDTAVDSIGGLDILVVAASALATEVSEASWKSGFETDLMGTVCLVGRALIHMKKSRSGSILIIGSTAALEIGGAMQPYRSFKAALLPYAKALAIEHAADNIRINLISPGYVKFKGGFWDNAERNNPNVYEENMRRVPIGRMAEPAEIARVATFLVSPAASYVTGSNFVVDGGLTRAVF